MSRRILTARVPVNKNIVPEAVVSAREESAEVVPSIYKKPKASKKSTDKDTGATTPASESSEFSEPDTKSQEVSAINNVETPPSLDSEPDTKSQEAIAIASTESKPTEEPEISQATTAEPPLLSLTSVYSQKTDTILNTLLFMCLDQGHDFHDGSTRTQTNDGKKTWVDLDFNGKGYLNRIPKTTFESDYMSGSPITADKIFGKNDFIKGLLNTTFIGGDGAYGLVVVDEAENVKLGTNPTEVIKNKIKDTIKINISSANQYYYIYSPNDTEQENGLTLTIEDKNASILFLPFYQRVYNGGMHKLWSFNTIKHVYLIKLLDFTIEVTGSNITVQTPNFTCETYTKIELVVPQYVMDFGYFIHKDYILTKKINDILEETIFVKPVSPDKFIEELEKLDDSKKEKVFNMFAEILLTGSLYVGDLKKETHSFATNPSSITYETGDGGIGSFSFTGKDEYYKNIARGVKYYFWNCQDQRLNFFLKMLYKYQKPFIHPEYRISSSTDSVDVIESAKKEINKKLSKDSQRLITEYDRYKNNNNIVEDTNNDFISKQYGFITDTNIGQGSKKSTADILIDSFNNVPGNTTCEETIRLVGGDGDGDDGDGDHDDGDGDKKGETPAFFDNIENVDEVFDLTLNSEKLQGKFVDINETNMNHPVRHYVEKYSNNLQLYYDFKPQNGKTSKPNYFNNCWQSTDFYQQTSQKGGSNYPFKFTVASGSLDSSSLGGQSVPQYHPPEVDIYMPIFDITNTGNLKGVIIRMVVVKEVLNNAINSKSQVVVFCHFVYVDFERTRIELPRQNDGKDDVKDYPDRFKKLLDFAINNTVYIGETSSCTDIGTELSSELNKHPDFRLDFNKSTDSGSRVSRYWYKYFTYTQGPTVKNSIVIPTSYFTLAALKLKAASDYVAKGIVDVAEYIIMNSSKLQGIFNNDDLKLLFIKMFLIRNKYTGDKSRSTDTLFLNQTKYLEGVQISNDENTLYNSQMFGLNTIWSTSAKSVFYMAPFLTQENKMTITNGSYVSQLCKGLKNNPENKGSTGSSKGKPANLDDEALAKQEFNDEFYQEILDTLDSEIKNNPGYKNFFNKMISGTLIECWSDCVYLMQKLNVMLDEMLNYSFESDLNIMINDFKNGNDPVSFKTPQTNAVGISAYISTLTGQTNNQDGLSRRLEAFIDIYNNIVTQKTALITKINDLVQTRQPIQIKDLGNMFLLLSKTFPWWSDLILEDKLIQYTNKLCNDYYIILNSVRNLFYHENIVDILEYCPEKFFIYKEFVSNYNYYKISIEPKLLQYGIQCFKFNGTIQDIGKQCKEPNVMTATLPEITKIKSKEIQKYLKEIDSQEISDLDPSIQTKLVEINENKFIKATTQLLNKLTQVQTTRSVIKLAEIIKGIQELDSAEDVILDMYDKQWLTHKPRPDVTQRSTEEVYTGESSAAAFGLGGGLNDNEIISETQSEPLDEESIKYIEELNKFYRDTYKCNVGNHLKNLIRIITETNSRYTDTSFTLNDDIRDIVIKILLKQIVEMNKSYIPNITSEDIIQTLDKIDDSYTIDQMVSVLNRYSNIFKIYQNINIISNSYDMTPIDLINILNENIDNNSLLKLNIETVMYILKQKINEPTSIESDDIIQSDEYKPFSMTQFTSLSKPFSPPFQSQIRHNGGNTKKNKIKKNRNTKSNKKYSKKRTIKRRNPKHKKYSRRH